MTDTQTLQAPPQLTYSVDMVERMRLLINEEIRQTKLKADRRVAELEQAMRDIEARQQPLPTFHEFLPEDRKDYPEQPVGRDPYAGAPEWADRTDERVKHLMGLREDGTDAGEGAQS